MRSTVDQLTPSETKALAHFYDTDAYKALKKLCELEIEGLGKDALASLEHDKTRWYGGQALMAAKIPKLIRGLYKEYDTDKKS